MGNFDEILTDPNLNLDLIETHIEGLTDNAYLLDRYHSVASGGSSGRRGVFVYDWDGWTLVYLGLIRYELRRQERERVAPAGPTCCTGPVDLAGLRVEIVAKLATVGLEDAEVTITTVDRLTRQDTGKLKRFVPQKPALVGR